MPRSLISLIIEAQTRRIGIWKTWKQFPFIRMSIRILLWLTCTVLLQRISSMSSSPLTHSSFRAYYILHSTAIHEETLTSVSFFLLTNFLVLLTLIHSISITYSVFHKNFINNYFSPTYKYFINKIYGIYFTLNYAWQYCVF